MASNLLGRGQAKRLPGSIRGVSLRKAGATMAAEEHERVEVSSAGELRAWLTANHEQDESVWLVTFKKHHGDRYVSRDEVLDELIGFGWIDGARRKLDDDRTMQLISPRRVHHWSKSYKDRAERLIAAGRMHDSGQRAIDRSKELGLWALMDDVDALLIPEDLRDALAARPAASANFDSLPDSAKRNTLRWIKLAKTDTTRQKRVEETSRRAARNERVPNT